MTSPNIEHPVRNRKGSLTVFAAASLTEALTGVGQAYEALNPDTKVIFNFAGSQQLAQQLVQGSPADVFISADNEQMDATIQAGRVVPESLQILVHNRLVVIVPKDNPAGLDDLKDLSQPDLKLVVADKAVPVGRYSLEFLEKASQDPSYGHEYKKMVLDNIVSYEENTRAVLSKVLLGEADAGIVYASDATAANPAQLGTIEIPSHLNVIATYYFAWLHDSPNPVGAESFAVFLLSPTAQEIFTQHGFISSR